MGKRTIARGVPAIQTVCGRPGTSAQKILHALVNQPESRDRHGTLHPHRIERQAGDNIRNLTYLTLSQGGERVNLRIICSSDVRPEPGTLILASDPWGTRSMVPARNEEGGFTLKVPEVLDDKEAQRMANHIAALFVIHGHGWTNAKGKHFAEPYGEPRRVRAHHRPYVRHVSSTACGIPAGKNHADRYSGIAHGPRPRAEDEEVLHG